MKPLPRIGFVLLSDARHPMPSTRIAVLNMLPFLREAGFDPHLVERPAEDTEQPRLEGMARILDEARYDVVVFQKVHGPHVVALARRLGERGTRTAFVVCDRVAPEMAEATDLTITVTDYLKDLYPAALRPKIRTVHDGIERPWVRKDDWGANRGSRADPLTAVLVTSAELDRLPVLGNPPPWLRVRVVGAYPPLSHPLDRLRQAKAHLDDASWQERRRILRFLAHPRIRCDAWDADGVYEAMREADIGIIPVDLGAGEDPAGEALVKSENRLTLKMAVGLPVVASPVPAYRPIVRQGVNAFLARGREEWIEALSALRDPGRRRAMGIAARVSVFEDFSQARQAERLVAALRELVPEPLAVA